MEMLRTRAEAVSVPLWFLLSLAMLTESANILCPDKNYTSPFIPTSVHRLRVGDIKVVAGMGDSLSVGSGAEAIKLLDLVNQYRGRSFSVGGDFSYEQSYTTFPNILRLFNPNLYGYSTGIGDEKTANAKFNGALMNGLSGTLVDQAKNLVERMRRDSAVDFEKDWKILTITVGSANLCGSCKDITTHPASELKSDLQLALDFLQQNLPRTLVNLIEPFDIYKLRAFAFVDAICNIAQESYLCPCGYEEVTFELRDSLHLAPLAEEYRSVVRELVYSKRYETSEDFTVVIQPFLSNFTLLRNEAGELDRSYLAKDCFHPNTKGHNMLGIALWNSMLRTYIHKQRHLDHDATPICPTTEYIPTEKNYL